MLQQAEAYASMSEAAEQIILSTNDTGEGSLERYSKTITTDAINQYSAQYHDSACTGPEF
jgi:hypothetical protein